MTFSILIFHRKGEQFKFGPSGFLAIVIDTEKSQ